MDGVHVAQFRAGEGLGLLLRTQLVHVGARHALAHQLQRLVGGDAAADDQQDLASGQRGHGHAADLATQPGDVFALVRWAANDFGTTVSRLDIVRAVAPPEPYATLPYVRPGGERLLSVNGWNNVQAALHAIDLVEKSGVDPADAAHDHWRHVHNRLTVGHQPRPYSAERHRAWLLRREARS